MRTTVAAAAIIDLNSTWYVWPRVLHLQHTSASQTALSGYLGYRLQPNKANVKSIFAGPVVRHGINRNIDAAALALGLQFKNLRAGVSYDFTVSSLGPSISARGALEFSLIYIPNPVVDRISIPCDRH